MSIYVRTDNGKRRLYANVNINGVRKRLSLGMDDTPQNRVKAMECWAQIVKFD
ncbi:Arm DNA-binding domain-containing protein [Helicobacter cynogastricus]|uniref:Arm DNA-binding domain-containing protein n=1 Tax=Helicobacter cynogastricus TaxID=329937 RepID=UPI001315AB77|nr:DUF3596 domain-containing protein [Helicobacter cynogastricus]